MIPCRLVFPAVPSVKGHDAAVFEVQTSEAANQEADDVTHAPSSVAPALETVITESDDQIMDVRVVVSGIDVRDRWKQAADMKRKTQRIHGIIFMNPGAWGDEVELEMPYVYAVLGCKGEFHDLWLTGNVGVEVVGLKRQRDAFTNVKGREHGVDHLSAEVFEFLDAR